MIKSLRLGNIEFTTNLIQGPLAGVSCAPFRELTWRYSKPAFCCTEMISCKTILHQPAIATRYLHRSAEEGPLCFQLSATDPAELASATQIVTHLGASLIDLNCRCPMKKIRSKGAGSALLTNQQLLYKLITAMKKNTTLPVSIKIRVDQHNQTTMHDAIIQVLNDAGADFVIVHGRHWEDTYDTPCRYDAIAYFVDNLSIPVIGNGDVVDKSSLQAMFATGCAGVMVSRAGVGQPWLIRQLALNLHELTFIAPSPEQIGFIMLEHISKLAKLLNHEKQAVLQARRFAKYYARGLPNRPAFLAALNCCDDFNALENIILTYFK